MSPATPRYSRWQRWLSYVKDVTLERGVGEFTEDLAVLLRQGKLILQANGAIYSWEDNYYNFREAFAHLDWSLLPGKETLLLGLGLGSVPQMAEELFGKQLSYVALEYDEAVAQLAHDYLLYRLKSPVEVVIADAEAFVLQDHRTYDLILADIFVDDCVPDQFETRAFLEALKQRLSPGACLVSNRLTFRDQDRAASERYYLDVFAQVFPEAAYLDVGSNWMLFSDERFLQDPD